MPSFNRASSGNSEPSSSFIVDDLEYLVPTGHFHDEVDGLTRLNRTGIGASPQNSMGVCIDTSTSDPSVSSITYSGGNGLSIGGGGFPDTSYVEFIHGRFDDSPRGSTWTDRSTNEPATRPTSGGLGRATSGSLGSNGITEETEMILSPIYFNFSSFQLEDNLNKFYDTVSSGEGDKLYITDINGLMLLKQLTYYGGSLYADTFFKSLSRVFENTENGHSSYSPSLFKNFFIIKMIIVFGRKGNNPVYVPDSIMVTAYDDFDKSIRSIKNDFIKELFNIRDNINRMFKTITRLEVLPNGKAKLTNIKI